MKRPGRRTIVRLTTAMLVLVMLVAIELRLATFIGDHFIATIIVLIVTIVGAAALSPLVDTRRKRR